MRLSILGNSGSGKSTLARHLARQNTLRLLDLDSVVWEPRKIAVARDRSAASADMHAFCNQDDGWIIEGCYADLVEQSLIYSPTLVFLDPGLETCLENCRSRPWEPHKFKSKMEQDEKLEFLLDWVRAYYKRDGELSFSAHEALFNNYGQSKVRLSTQFDPQCAESLPDFAR